MIQDKKKIVVVLVVIVVLAGLGYKYYLGRSYKDPNLIRASGNIEVTDVEMSFKIPGHVDKRFVSEGEKVAIGQDVARLDTSELIQEVAVRKAEVETAQSMLAELEAGSRPEEIAQAEAVVARTRADMDRAEADRNRQKELYEKNTISTERYQQYETAYQVANARWHEAMEQLTLLRKGPRKEKIEQARSRLQEARERLKLAETRLGYATLTSPISGVVLSENVEPGEYVMSGTPVVTIGDLEHPWVRAYINETDLGRVKVGQAARVTTDTYPSKAYEGKVSFIASEAEFTPKQVQTEKERVKLVFRVKITVSNPNMELKPGMPADADILLQ
jgi:HlyD family secretion protein